MFGSSRDQRYMLNMIQHVDVDSNAHSKRLLSPICDYRLCLLPVVGEFGRIWGARRRRNSCIRWNRSAHRAILLQYCCRLLEQAAN